MKRFPTMSLDPLAFHLGLVFLALLGGYYLAQLGETLFPALSIPIFAVAFLCGLALQLVMSRTGIARYVDGSIVGNINASSTELLVTFGIAAIQLGVVVNYIAPLTILLIFGILYCLLLFRFLAPRIFDEYSFERGIFTWGWSTGAVAMGIALLKVVDPKGDSKTLSRLLV